MARKPIDYARITELAASGLSQAKVAEALGMGYSTLTALLTNNVQARAAYDEGRIRLMGGSARVEIVEEPDGLTEDQREVFRAIRAGMDRAPQVRVETGLDYNVIQMAATRLKEIGAIVGWRDAVSGSDRWKVAEKKAVEVRVADEPIGDQVIDLGTFDGGVLRSERTNGHKGEVAPGEGFAEAVHAMNKKLAAVSTSELMSSSVVETKCIPISMDEAIAAASAQGAVVVKIHPPADAGGTDLKRVRALEAARVELLYQRIWGQSSPRCSDAVELIEEELEFVVGGVTAS